MIQKLIRISLQADDFTIMGFFVTYKHDAVCNYYLSYAIESICMTSE